MKSIFLKYLLQLLVFGLVLYVVLYTIPALFLSRGGFAYLGVVTVYFLVVTALFHYGLLRVSGGKPAAFIRYYMAATTLKLFLHLGVLVLVVLFRQTVLLPFAITFLVHYLTYTAFEVYQAYRHSRSSVTTSNR